MLTPIRKIKHVKNYTLYYGENKNNIISDGKNYTICKDWHDGILDLLLWKEKNNDIVPDDFNIDSIVSFEKQ